MMRINCQLLLLAVLFILDKGNVTANSRQRRYLIFTKSTQWGVFVTVSIPIHPESTTSVAWFYEANYYNVDNSTYLQPLLGDIPWGRSQAKRSTDEDKNEVLTRKILYKFIETMLTKNNYAGRACLLRVICEAATACLTHNGVLGDLLHLALTPSTSLEELDLEDCYYEAEYRGIHHDCARYLHDCPASPLDHVSILIDHV